MCDLVGKLRAQFDYSLCQDAADRIEALEKELGPTRIKMLELKNYVGTQPYHSELESLRSQLAEKDKEIERERNQRIVAEAMFEPVAAERDALVKERVKLQAIIGELDHAMGHIIHCDESKLCKDCMRLANSSHQHKHWVHFVDDDSAALGGEE